VVAPGWVGSEIFLTGYGAAQAVPGPLFTFSAYLGTVMIPEPNGVIGGLIALGAIFLPAFFLTIGPLPFWDILRRRPAFQSVLRGVNAAVVGLLLAALYDPVWTSAVNDASDFALASAALGLLMLWKLPPCGGDSVGSGRGRSRGDLRPRAGSILATALKTLSPRRRSRSAST